MQICIPYKNIALLSNMACKIYCVNEDLTLVLITTAKGNFLSEQSSLKLTRDNEVPG